MQRPVMPLGDFRHTGVGPSWTEDSLHPLLCLHGHMCGFIDIPLIVIKALPPQDNVPLPVRLQPVCVSMIWGFISSSTGDSSRHFTV